MASLEKTIAIIFEGHDKVGGTITKVGRSLDRLEGSAESVARPLASIGNAVLAADAALAAFTAGGLAYAYNKSMEFESAAIELKKVIGDEAAMLDVARKRAMELSDQYGESSRDILLTTANYKQAGFDIKDSMTLAKAGLDLVIAGDIEAANASEYLIATLKGFKAPASEANRLIDILNEVSNNYATNVEELARGMSRISPIASNMNFSFEETAGILTPVIEIFRSGDEAATALKTGLLKLVDDTKPVQDALEAIGVSQRDANGKLRSGKDILMDVARAFQTAEENEKLFLTQQLVGIHQAGRMVEVFDNLSKTTEVTETALRAAGSASEEVAARLAASEVQVERFKKGFENLGIAIGDKFREAATQAVRGGTDIENTLRGLVEQGTFDPLFDELSAFSVRLGEFLEAVAEAMPEAFEDIDWSGLLDSLGDMGEEIGSLFDDLDLTDPEDLAVAIQAVVDTVESLVRVTQGMIEYFEPVWDSIREGIRQVNGLDEESQKSFGNLLGAAELVVHAGAKIAAALIVIKESGAGIERVFNVYVGTIRGLWNTVQVAFDSAARLMADIIAYILGLVESVTSIIPGMDGISASIGEAREAVEAFRMGAFLHQMEQMEEAADGFGQAWAGLSGSAYEADRTIRDMNKTIDALPAEKTTTVKADVNDAELTDWGKELEKTVTPMAVAATVDEEQTKAELQKVPEKRVVTLAPAVDSAKAEEARLKLDRDFALKTLKIETDLQIEKVRSQAKMLEETLQYKAKVDVAEIEAASKEVEAMFGSIDTTMKSTEGLISDLVDTWSDAETLSRRWTVEEWIEKEQRRREEVLASQKKLTDLQARLLEKRLETMEDGDALITISADGLEPELAAFMWEVLNRVQTRANQEGSEFLFGL